VEPEIIGHDKLAPVTPTRAVLHEMACQFAERLHRSGADLVFVWGLAQGQEILWIETAWTSEREKVNTILAMRDLMSMTKTHAYATITSAWMATMDENTDPLDRTLMDEHRAAGGMICDLPARLRQDVLMIATCDRAGDGALTRYIVDAKNQLGPRQDVSNYEALEGRLVNMLKPDPEADRRLEKRLEGMVTEMVTEALRAARQRRR
jgi:hypothetical protein